MTQSSKRARHCVSETCLHCGDVVLTRREADAQLKKLLVSKYGRNWYDYY